MRFSDLQEELRRGWARDLTEETIDALIAQSRIIDGSAEQVLFRHGDEPDGFYIVLVGQVRFGRETACGMETLLAILGPGMGFGDLSSISGRARSHRATCDVQCALLHTPLASFRSLMSTHADFATAIATQMAKRTHELFDMIGDQMVLNVQSRLAKRLLALATSMYGYEPLPEQPRIRITQSDLSKLTGATRQSISVHLLGWQKQGLIRQEYGYIHILDLVGIQRQADVS